MARIVLGPDYGRMAQGVASCSDTDRKGDSESRCPTKTRTDPSVECVGFPRDCGGLKTNCAQVSQCSPWGLVDSWTRSAEE